MTTSTIVTITNNTAIIIILQTGSKLWLWLSINWKQLHFALQLFTYIPQMQHPVLSHISQPDSVQDEGELDEVGKRVWSVGVLVWSINAVLKDMPGLRS